MTISTVQYADSNNNSLLITNTDGSLMTAPWPNGTWLAEEIQKWLDVPNTIIPVNVPTLGSVQVEERSRIDVAAYHVRLRYKTPNKDATYILKSQELDAYVLASYPADLTGYGYIKAEITALGLDPTILADRQTAAATITNARDAWTIVDASIEEQTLLGKANVSAAIDSAGAILAADTAIVLLNAI